MTSPSLVRRPAIRRESVLADHAASVDLLFSLIRPAVALPPRRGLAGSHRAYSSELTPRSRTARPFPNLSALQSKRHGTERVPADSAPRAGAAVRRQVSGTEARLDQPTDAMPESAVAAEPTKPSIPANARPHRTGSQSVPSRWTRVEFDRVDGRHEVQSWPARNGLGLRCNTSFGSTRTATPHFLATSSSLVPGAINKPTTEDFNPSTRTSFHNPCHLPFLKYLEERKW